MYIPLGTSLAEPPSPGTPYFLKSVLGHLAAFMAPPSSAGLKRRGDASHNMNVTIGIIVAIVLTAFITGTGYFMYRYRGSIRFSPRRRHRHSGKRRTSTGSSKSSKSSKSGRSASGEEPPPPPPPPSSPPGDPPAD
ncbi:uncharacterized protein DNG_05750 [Cephalotrichum gorgonifer]|uniref:Uncharacterized protein n=1 Tax=Cephalotrichum gorgonifer TaxID=2041049 RepID=A0AAE8N0F1_9PEZI|nr:uncharacterized protein DNG_05750 [Cephalotrichum gorgonifer]